MFFFNGYHQAICFSERIFKLRFPSFAYIIIKNVPCEECEQCGEKYYTDEVAEKIERMVNLAKQMMQEIAVLDYAKVS